MKPMTCIIALGLIALFHTTSVFSAEQITITTGEKAPVKLEKEHIQSKTFCSSTSKEEAKTQCETWMKLQKESLGARYLTSFCQFPTMTQSTDGCTYQSQGELRYILKLCEQEPTK